MRTRFGAFPRETFSMITKEIRSSEIVDDRGGVHRSKKRYLVVKALLAVRVIVSCKNLDILSLIQ